MVHIDSVVLLIARAITRATLCDLSVYFLMAAAVR